MDLVLVVSRDLFSSAGDEALAAGGEQMVLAAELLLLVVVWWWCVYNLGVRLLLLLLSTTGSAACATLVSWLATALHKSARTFFTLLLLRSRITSLLALCRSRAHWDCLGLSLGDLHSLGGAPVALPHSAQASSSSPTPVAAAAALLAGSLRWPWAEGPALPPFGADNREPGATNETHRATSSSSQVDLSPENAMREHEEKKPLNSVRESTSAVASSGEDS